MYFVDFGGPAYDFGLPYFLMCFGFEFHLGNHFACFPGCLGTFKIKLECVRGCQLHTSECLFLGADSRSISVMDFSRFA